MKIIRENNFIYIYMKYHGFNNYKLIINEIALIIRSNDILTMIF